MQYRTVSGASSAGDVAEFGFYDFDGVAAGTPFEPVESGVEGEKEGVVGIGDAAADDDGFGIVDVNQAGEGCAEGFDGTKPDFCGFR